MRFTFVAAYRYDPELLPTTPHDAAVIPVFCIEQPNYTDMTFTHVIDGLHGRAA